MSSSLGHYPKDDKWSFDETVAPVFDDMLSRSIPQYWIMRHAVNDLAKQFIQKDTDIIDIGCSSGGAIESLVNDFQESNRFIGLEVSESMLDEARKRFKSEIEKGSVEIRKHDLREGYPDAKASLTLSILTLQFTPIEYRQQIIQSIYDSTVSGGVFICVEKVLGNTAKLNDSLVTSYYNMKRNNGYTQEEIDRKRFSLEGVLVPITANWNEELFKRAGFKQVDCFWRWMNFAGWIAIKE